VHGVGQSATDTHGIGDNATRQERSGMSCGMAVGCGHIPCAPFVDHRVRVCQKQCMSRWAGLCHNRTVRIVLAGHGPCAEAFVDYSSMVSHVCCCTAHSISLVLHVTCRTKLVFKTFELRQQCCQNIGGQWALGTVSSPNACVANMLHALGWL
jgi:hypothetical protein